VASAFRNSAPSDTGPVALRYSEFKLKSGINGSPTGYPIYSVLNLSSLPLRTERSPYFVFDYLLARSSLSKLKPNPANREKRKSMSTYPRETGLSRVGSQRTAPDLLLVLLLPRRYLQRKSLMLSNLEARGVEPLSLRPSDRTSTCLSDR
jgi:hypothetical protein